MERKRPAVQSPYFLLAVFALLYGVFFRDNSRPAALPALCLVLAAGCLLLIFQADTRAKRIRALCLTAVFAVLCVFIYQSETQFIALAALFALAPVCLTIKWKREKTLTEDKIAALILLSGILLRLLYVLYTSCIIRQHDVGRNGMGYGHIGYIQYILSHGFRLPAFDMNPISVSQFSHPPLHHFLAAIWVRVQMALGLGMNDALESVQVLTLTYAALSMVAASKLLKALGLKGRALYAALALVSFSPGLIFAAGSINNDGLMTMFVLFTLLNGVLWYQKPTVGRIAATALTLAGAVLSKASGIFAALPLAYLFLVKLIKERRHPAAVIRQYALFLLLAVPLSLSYLTYCNLRWGMPFNYVLRMSTHSDLYIGGYSTFERLFSFDRAQLRAVYVTLRGEHQDYNLPLTFLKQCVFEEYTLSNQPDSVLMNVSRALFLTNALMLGAMLVNLARVTIKRLRDKTIDSAPWIAQVLYGAALMVFYVLFCFDYPFTSTPSIRYILTGIPLCAAALCLDGPHARFRHGLAWTFSVLSLAQFLLLAV